jgi:hypothetical protein
LAELAPPNVECPQHVGGLGGCSLKATASDRFWSGPRYTNEDDGKMLRRYWTTAAPGS